MVPKTKECWIFYWWLVDIREIISWKLYIFVFNLLKTKKRQGEHIHVNSNCLLLHFYGNVSFKKIFFELQFNVHNI